MPTDFAQSPTAGRSATAPTCIVSYKTEAAREQILQELEEWTLLAQSAGRASFRDAILPKQNAERHAPQLLIGDASAPLERTVLRARCLLWPRFRGRLFRRALPRPARESAIRQANGPAPAAQLFRLHLLVFGRRRPGRRRDAEHRSLHANRSTAAAKISSSTSSRRTAIASIADDVFAVLPRLARKGERFDAIILDPPTFSRSRTGKSWQVEHDFEKLFLAALEVAERDAKILLATNCTRLERAHPRNDGPLLSQGDPARRELSIGGRAA